MVWVILAIPMQQAKVYTEFMYSLNVQNTHIHRTVQQEF